MFIWEQAHKMKDPAEKEARLAELERESESEGTANLPDPVLYPILAVAAAQHDNDGDEDEDEDDDLVFDEYGEGGGSQGNDAGQRRRRMKRKQTRSADKLDLLYDNEGRMHTGIPAFPLVMWVDIQVGCFFEKGLLFAQHILFKWMHFEKLFDTKACCLLNTYCSSGCILKSSLTPKLVDSRHLLFKWMQGKWTEEKSLIAFQGKFGGLPARAMLEVTKMMYRTTNATAAAKSEALASSSSLLPLRRKAGKRRGARYTLRKHAADGAGGEELQLPEEIFLPDPKIVQMHTRMKMFR